MDPKLEKWQKHWLKMSIEKQFETAVSIIKNLPKDGKEAFKISDKRDYTVHFPVFRPLPAFQ